MKTWSLWSESYYKNMESGFENKFRKKLCTWVLEQKPKIKIMKDQKDCIRGYEEFKY